MDADGREAQAELAVLTATDYPGLAPVLDHGPLSGGGTYVARAWVEGAPLSARPSPLGADLIEEGVAQVAAALEHLHQRGFVHGDLKSGNVIVAPDRRLILCDFGMSRRLGSDPTPEAGGTLFHIAPEVLRGGSPREASDLFALGILALEQLGVELPEARTFYGRFPAESLFDAAGLDPAALPDWARRWIPGLVDRDPERRPSAAWVARGLGRKARGGDAALGPPRLHWPWVEGREKDIDTAVGQLGPGHGRWVVPETIGLDRIARSLSTYLTLGGRAALHLDLGAEWTHAPSAEALDQWAQATVNTIPAGALVFVTSGSGSVAGRARTLLGRALTQRNLADPEPRRAKAPSPRILVSIESPGEASPFAEGELLRLPGVDANAILERVRAWFPNETVERLTPLVDRLEVLSEGSTQRIVDAMQHGLDEGWIRMGSEGLELRRGPLPEGLGRDRGRGADPRMASLPEVERIAFAALMLLGEQVDRGTWCEVTALHATALQAAIERGLRRGWLSREWEASGGARFRWARSWPRRKAFRLGAARWRKLEEAVATERARGPTPELQWTHRGSDAWGAEEVHSFREALAHLRRTSAGERALEALLRLKDNLLRESGRWPAVFQAELSFCHADLGEVEAARTALEELEASAKAPDPTVNAIVERTRGRLAHHGQRFAEALEHLERAANLDPMEAPAARHARVRVLYEAGMDGELSDLHAEVSGETSPDSILVHDLEALGAMALHRRGEFDEAHRRLSLAVERSVSASLPAAEAPDRINLGILARDRGELGEARDHLLRAAALYRELGFLPGRLQAEAMLATVLREAGDLAGATERIRGVVEARERLGDRVGSVRARALHALVLGERGHAAESVEGLRGAARVLEESGSTRDVPWLRARAAELDGRLGRPTPVGSALHSPAPDPRVLLAQARMSWCGGRPGAARRLTDAALERARELRRPPLVDEASLLLQWIDATQAPGNPGPQSPHSFGSPRITEDAEIAARIRDASLQDPRATLDWARELQGRGRDDRAARLARAVAARSDEPSLRREASELEASALSRCERACSVAERRVLRLHLLGVPDPAPLDFHSDSEDLDMDVLTLLELNQRLVNQEGVPELLGAIVENALMLTGAERGFLVLEEDGELSMDLALDSVRGDLKRPEVEVSHSILREALASDRPLRLSNAAADPLHGAAASVSALGLRSVLVHAFDVQAGLRGVLYVDHRVSEGLFDERAERLIGLLAGQAALAIRQIRRLEQIHELNHELGQRVAVQDSDLRAAHRALERSGVPVPIAGMVGESPAMAAVQALLRRAAGTRIPVLVSGPSGTGKELAAQALHSLAPWSEGPFVAENCAALPASLIEAELFGARRGSFTGADQDRTGLFERAEGGTLFLDEIGELPLDLQAKLLRVLETREVRPLGADAPVSVEFRLVAATNRDLHGEVEAGRFRADLMYRLDGLRVDMPPISERTEDIPDLVDHFLRIQESRDGIRRGIGREVLDRLVQRAWPGNVRELSNEVARLCVLSDGDLLDPDLVRPPSAQSRPADGRRGSVIPLAELERQAILDALERTKGDKRKAAQLLGISRTKVYQRLKEWGEDDTE